MIQSPRRVVRRALTAVVSVVVTFGLFATAVAAVADWNYTDLGPDEWASSFPECGGSEQSPINIDGNAVDAAIHELKAQRRGGKKIDGITVDYNKSVDVEVFNNTHTIQVDIPAGAGSFSIGDETYELLQFHFHAPSEHAVNGQLYPIEMHLVHANADGELAVLGIFMEAGRANRILAPVWADLPDVDDRRRVPVSNFRLSKLAPKKPTAVSYMGSLTTPPCSEGVSWFVLGQTQELSKRQLSNFEAIFSGKDFPEGNRRPVQPLNDREIAVTPKARGGSKASGKSDRR